MASTVGISRLYGLCDGLPCGDSDRRKNPAPPLCSVASYPHAGANINSGDIEKDFLESSMLKVYHRLARENGSRGGWLVRLSVQIRQRATLPNCWPRCGAWWPNQQGANPMENSPRALPGGSPVVSSCLQLSQGKRVKYFHVRSGYLTLPRKLCPSTREIPNPGKGLLPFRLPAEHAGNMDRSSAETGVPVLRTGAKKVHPQRRGAGYETTECRIEEAHPLYKSIVP